MKHLVAISALSLLLFMTAPALIAAKDGGHDGDHHGEGESGTRVEVSTNHSSGSSEVGEAVEPAEVEDEAAEVAEPAEAADVEEAPVVAGTATFEIQGEVTAISGTTFTVAGLSITNDPTLVPEFKMEGTLAVGSMVKVEGMISGGVFLAEEIKVL